MADESLLSMISEYNRQTRGNWDCFAGHRERIRNLLAANCPEPARSICVLGAGNANDLDLPWLVERFDNVTLVDLDVQAMGDGVCRQLGDARRVKLVECDVTGIFRTLEESPLAEHQLDTIQAQLSARPVATTLKERYDCVVSACLLSQLIDGLKKQVGEGHSRFLSVVLAIRSQHLDLLTQLASPEGLVVLAFDFVSSLTCPDLDRISDSELASYAGRQLERHNFFTGLNPLRVEVEFSNLLRLQGVAPATLTPPWRWNLGPRSYLVAAILASMGSSQSRGQSSDQPRP